MGVLGGAGSDRGHVGSHSTQRPYHSNSDYLCALHVSIRHRHGFVHPHGRLASNQRTAGKAVGGCHHDDCNRLLLHHVSAGLYLPVRAVLHLHNRTGSHRWRGRDLGEGVRLRLLPDGVPLLQRNRQRSGFAMDVGCDQFLLPVGDWSPGHILRDDRPRSGSKCDMDLDRGAILRHPRVAVRCIHEEGLGCVQLGDPAEGGHGRRRC
mmetsp:Transcript_21607/g.60146  ORF Transcript_21607/g.60146 Transcript_21607/m.60146 type:complete len:207 (-) Transcript_21607:161-781(-)